MQEDKMQEGFFPLYHYYAPSEKLHAKSHGPSVSTVYFCMLYV